MAVEANHLHVLTPQLFMDRDLLAGAVEAQTGLLMPTPFYGENRLVSTACVLGKKRPRETLSYLGEVMPTDLQQNLFDQDCLITHHTNRISAELEERRKQLSWMLVAEVIKKLKAKDDEIEALKKLNWVLEERVQSLCAENQIWRELAEANEATVNLLRANLEQVLAAQICATEEGQEQYVDPVEDAESCCCGDNEGLDSMVLEVSTGLRVCRSCRGSEPTVLLLPCRHLCLCAICSPTITFCPVCNFVASGRVSVNLS